MRTLEGSNRVRNGVMGIILLVVVIGVGQSFASVPMLFATPTYYAQFSDTGGLNKSDKVRIAGVDVGKVRSMSIDGDKVVIGFGLDGTQRLVDLPGYGFAKVPGRMKEHWQELLTRYVEARASLVGLVIVMDARRPLTDFDVQMLDWSGANGLATHILLKADKLSRSESGTVLKQVRAQVEGVATVQLFSAVAKTGVDDARREVLRMLTRKPSDDQDPEKA